LSVRQTLGVDSTHAADIVAPYVAMSWYDFIIRVALRDRTD